ncbi:unnamed protein product [Albugo candida]|uniref:Uncharacterized protein n=1 Tax=Albugo candida TaxID=65357 RepID=A0A024GRU6_9STRA|nr:unnamed protein product [Albugo candida]|eukprot:CCI49645.1 unnamed protein product [Albugo candida]
MLCQHLSAIIFAILALAPTINANSKIAMKNASDISVNDKYHYDFELQVTNKLICLEILQVHLDTNSTDSAMKVGEKCSGRFDCEYGNQCVHNKCSNKPGVLQHVGMTPRANDLVARTENSSHRDCVKQFASKNGAKDTEYPLYTYDEKTSQCTHAAGIKGLTYKDGAETGLLPMK